MNLAEIKAAAEESLAHTWSGGEIPIGPSIPGAYQDAVRAEKANARNVLWLGERCEALETALEALLHHAERIQEHIHKGENWYAVRDCARAALARLEDSP